MLDTRFEINRVSPASGSDVGGALVTIEGKGFGSPEKTSQRMVAALGTFGDVVSWTPTKIIFTTRKVTLNTDLVDVTVNIIEAVHRCGEPDATGEFALQDCKHAAFNVPFTPLVTAMTPSAGRAGQMLELTVKMPDGQGRFVHADNVTVKLGDHYCGWGSDNTTTKVWLTVTLDTLQVSCIIPEFAASKVPVRLLILPLGYARSESGDELTYDQQLIVDQMTPNSGSLGGRRVFLQGAGFSSHTARHWVRIGHKLDDGGVCEPITSSYNQLECIMSWRDYDQDWSRRRRRATRNEEVEVALWDKLVFDDPLAAFLDGTVGCMRHENDRWISSVYSPKECALRCLQYKGCRSFEYRPRYMQCIISEESFTSKSDSEPQGWDDCRYFEKRTEQNAALSTSVIVTNGFTYSDDLTPWIDQMWVVNADPWRGSEIQTTDTGCGATHSNLESGNDQCCASTACSWGEGRCNSNDQCAGNLYCASYACSWAKNDYSGSRRRAHNEDHCCALRSSEAHNPWLATLWRPGDQIVVRFKGGSLGASDQSNNNAADSAVTAAKSNPGNGHVKISFDGVDCPVNSINVLSDRDSHADVVCTLGEVPGGLAHIALAEIATMGRAIEPDDWLAVPLQISGILMNASAEAMEAGVTSVPVSASSLGGGWVMTVLGVGFAPPLSAKADSYIEVAVCGRPCSIVSGTYESVSCVVPNVTIAEMYDGSLPDMIPPPSRAISQGAGLVTTLSPASCFQGKSASEYQVNHPGCMAVFDGDSEQTGGLTGGGCHVGVDFGEYTNARVEQIRFFPRYSSRDASKLVNARFEVGTLDETLHATCDELTLGWRGSGYRGCQNVNEKGEKCAPWTNFQGGTYSNRVPELASHSYCRNPDPAIWYQIWCYNEKGQRKYCKPKVPAITWETVHTLKKIPKMLWNGIKLTTPKVARFVRYTAPGGECRMVEIQVIGNLVAPSSTCPVTVRNVRRVNAPGGFKMDLDLPALEIHHKWTATARGFMEGASAWATNAETASITFSSSETPFVSSIEPWNGTARGGTEVTLTGTKFGDPWTPLNMYNDTGPVTVTLNSYDCKVISVTSTVIKCITSPRNNGIKRPSLRIDFVGRGFALTKSGLYFRYLDPWSDEATWADNEPPIDGDTVIVPDGQAIMLDENTPKLNAVIVQGILVFDDRKDLEMHAKYIWVKGGTMEVGTESRPFYKKATITLYGEKYEAIRLPVIGAKCLAVSNEQFTIREGGDGAAEEGKIGTLDIHGAPRRKVWTRLAKTIKAGESVMVLQDKVDFVSGEELVITTTDTPPKEMHGEGLHGAPPVDFNDERIIVQSLGTDFKTVTLKAPVKHTHISTHYIRPDGEYVDLSAEVGLLSRNVKIQGEHKTSEEYSWGGHTQVAFGGIYRVENTEFYMMGQTGELSRYPIHFHVIQDWGKLCYAKHNSIHHSFQRAVAIHSTEYVTVKGNVAFDIIGHMFFVETGMERYNVIEGNLGIGAIPLMSGMLESDQEPAAFWTAAPNNIWRDNVAVTGSDGWYFQLPDHPISHNQDIYKDSVCPVSDRIGEWSKNRCHHTVGSCIRVYMTWKPYKDPCNRETGEAPQMLFNTTCWGIGFICFNAMFPGSIHNKHMTAVETGLLPQGGPDVWYGTYHRDSSYLGGKWMADWHGIPHVEDSVFVGVLPQNLAGWRNGTYLPREKKPVDLKKWKSTVFEMPQDEHFFVDGAHFVNYEKVPIFQDCSMCYSNAHWRQGAFTYHFKNLNFHNSTKRIFVYKKGIYRDIDGSLTGVQNSYTTWADRHNIVEGVCELTQGLQNYSVEENLIQHKDILGINIKLGTMHDTGARDESDTWFHVSQNLGSLIHSRRLYSFITCTLPIRKIELLFPEPEEVYLRQMNITNLDTGLTQVYEYEQLEKFGWTFPAVVNRRFQVRPNLPGLDFQEGSIRYAVSDLLQLKMDEASKNAQIVKTEWMQLVVTSWSTWDHYTLKTPDWELYSDRRGALAGQRAKDVAVFKDFVSDPATFSDPSTVNSLTHGMLDGQNWSVIFKFPDTDKAAKPLTEEPYTLRFKAYRCPPKGCTAGLPPLNQEWPTYQLWSEVFGITTRNDPIVIESSDWIVYDMAGDVQVKNITIFGKLSFDDSADRSLEMDAMVVWGLLEVGTSTSPFGYSTGKTARIKLRGTATNVQTYVYIEEQTLHNKVIAVPGRVETFGVPYHTVWTRLKSTASNGATSACVMPVKTGAFTSWTSGNLQAATATTTLTTTTSTNFIVNDTNVTNATYDDAMTTTTSTILTYDSNDSNATASIRRLQEAIQYTGLEKELEEAIQRTRRLDERARRLAAGLPADANGTRLADFELLGWKTGTEVVFAPTEFDNPWGHTETRTLTQDPVWDVTEQCWTITWTTGLSQSHYAGDIPIGNGESVSLRAVVGALDRSVVFEAADSGYPGGSYGGHFEIFDLPLMTPPRVGKVDLRWTRMKYFGKGGLEGAVKIGYESNYVPRPINFFEGCAWTNSMWYPLRLATGSSPIFVKSNIFAYSENSGVYMERGSTKVTIVSNAAIGLRMSPVAPMATNELNSNVRVLHFAGFRTDEMPVRMFGNVVAGSNDMGFMHRAEDCVDAPRIFDNEVFSVVVGVFLYSRSSGRCQMANLYTVWKAAHIGVYLSDVKIPFRLDHITVSDSHLGIVPYFTSGRAFRRLWVYNSKILGSTPASSCSASAFCRAQTAADYFMQNCNSVFAPINFRRVGYVVALNTGNKKNCDSTSDYRACRMNSPAFPKIECHFPWEYHAHFDRGLGWSFFEGTVFGYWKESDCGRTSRAISQNPSAPEIQFPITFTNTRWYESDAKAKFELKAEVLHDAYKGRKTPCNNDGGGCMGLDQLLFQDVDGTLLGLGAGASVVPWTPRTEIVWSSLCVGELDSVEVDALICPNVTVQLVEMHNLDRGAKDIKFGPLALTPDPEEANGFGGGVISSVGPFYGSCPCGWDFSFYHILVKPLVTYYAEVISFPENFRLRYWSTETTDSVVLQFFYPDSAGVNVFVGGSSEPDMSIKLARVPTKEDAHGAHTVDSQAKRLYITLRGSPQGFNAGRDLIIRKTPTVKLKINVQISLTEFNGPSFAMNLAVLLGIGPERIKVVAVGTTRRLKANGRWDNLDDEYDDDEESWGRKDCTWRGCEEQLPTGRRLSAASATDLDVSISPSDSAAASSSGSSTSTASLNSQASELGGVSQSLTTLSSGDSLAAAAGGTVSVSDIETPAVADTSAEEAVSEADTAQPTVVNVVEAAAAVSATEVSADAGCPAGSSLAVTVGDVTESITTPAAISSGESSLLDCTLVTTQYEGNMTLTCSSGSLEYEVDDCLPRKCSAGVSVTVGSTTSVYTPAATIASGSGAVLSCSTINAAFSGSVQLSCLKGTLSADSSNCMGGCETAMTVNITVAGVTASWSPSADMVSGSKDYASCEPINAGYEGQVEISCFFGVLSINPSQCIGKPCNVGDQVSVTLPSSGSAVTLTLGTKVTSGLTTTVACSSANAEYSESMTLSCSLGVLTYDISTCKLTCPTSMSKTITVGSSSSSVSPSARINHGDTEPNLACSAINSGYTGEYSLECSNGVLTADTQFCTAATCPTSGSISITLGGQTVTVSPSDAVASGSFFPTLCADINSNYDGLISVDCLLGNLVSNPDVSGCVAKPCQPWDFVSATVGGVTGLVSPLAQISAGATGVGNCNAANVEYGGDIDLSCSSDGTLTVTSVSQCKGTCPVTASATTSIGGVSRTVNPPLRMAHDATSVADCSIGAPGYNGNVSLKCADTAVSITGHNCQPDNCPANLYQTVTVGDKMGKICEKTLETTHGTIWTNPCNYVNVRWEGDITCTCNLGALTADVSGCTALPCPTSMSILVVVGEGSSPPPEQVMSPTSTISSGSTESFACSTVKEGLSGTIVLDCDEGVLNATHTCLPQSCDASTTPITVDIGGVITTVKPSGTMVSSSNFSTNCGDINSGYNLSFNTECYFGQLRNALTSMCNPRSCPKGMMANAWAEGREGTFQLPSEMLSGAEHLYQCTDLLPSLSGNLKVSCQANVLTVNASSCEYIACNDTSTSVVVGGTSGEVRTRFEVLHGQTFTTLCNTIHIGYSGDIVTTCSNTVISADISGCSAKPCPTGAAVTVSADGFSGSYQLATDLTSGSQRTLGCSSAVARLLGNMVLSCEAEVLTVNDTSCFDAGCDAQSTPAPTAVGGTSGTTVPSSVVVSGSSFTTLCSSIHSGYMNNIVTTCSYEVLTANASACAPKPCATGADVTVTAGLFSGTYQLASQLESGTSRVKPCSDAISRLLGDMELSCEAGVLSVNDTSCINGGCDAQSAPAPVTVGGTAGTTLPSSLIVSGQTFTTSCSDINSGYQGNIVTTCLIGDMAANASGCSPKPCPVDQAQTVIAAIQYKLPFEMASGSGAVVQCSDASLNLVGNLSLSCSLGALSTDGSGCSYRCIVGQEALVQLGSNQYTTTIDTILAPTESVTQSCESVHNGWKHDFTITCNDGGTLTSDPSTCMAKACQPGDYTTLTVGNILVGPSITSVMQNGESGSWSCFEVVGSGWSGTGTIECVKGALVASGENCVPPAPIPTCASGTAVTFVLADEARTIGLTATIATGTSEESDCSAAASGTTGKLKLVCGSGTLTADTSGCGAASCTASSVEVVLGSKKQRVSYATLQHGVSGETDCETVNDGYQEKIRVTCNYGRVTADVSQCSPRGCTASEQTIPVGGEDIQLVVPQVPLESGGSKRRGCSMLGPAYIGEAEVSCAYGETSVDVSDCTRSCLSGHIVTVAIGPVGEDLALKSRLNSGAAARMRDCAEVDESYEGKVALTCNFGTLSVDPSACVEAGCYQGDTQEVTIEGASATQLVPGLPLQSGESTSAECSEMEERMWGSATVTCKAGVASVEAFDCTRGCLPTDSAPLTIGDMTQMLAPPTKVQGATELQIPCASLDPGLQGMVVLGCLKGGTLSASEECSLRDCQAGDVEVTVGTASATVTASQEYPNEGSFQHQCSDINSDYEGTVNVVCSSGLFQGNVAGCKPKPGKEAVEVTVVKSAISIALPAVEGATVETMQAAMDTPSVKEAFGASIAAGLGMDPQDVRVLRLIVFGASGRRLNSVAERTATAQNARLLAASDSLGVKVDYEVIAAASAPGSSGSSTNDDLSQRMLSMGDSKSEANNQFSSAFQKELKEAAETSDGDSGLLTSMSEEVEAKGMRVQAVQPPKTEVRLEVATTTTTTTTTGISQDEGAFGLPGTLPGEQQAKPAKSKDKDEPSKVEKGAMMAAIPFGISLVIAIALYFMYVRKKNQKLYQVEEMEDDYAGPVANIHSVERSGSNLGAVPEGVVHDPVNPIAPDASPSSEVMHEPNIDHESEPSQPACSPREETDSPKLPRPPTHPPTQKVDPPRPPSPPEIEPSVTPVQVERAESPPGLPPSSAGMPSLSPSESIEQVEIQDQHLPGGISDEEENASIELIEGSAPRTLGSRSQQSPEIVEHPSTGSHVQILQLESTDPTDLQDEFRSLAAASANDSVSLVPPQPPPAVHSPEPQYATSSSDGIVFHHEDCNHSEASSSYDPDDLAERGTCMSEDSV
jgi:hypothetical protein